MTTEIKKDNRQEITHLKRRLQKYRIAYIREAERTLNEFLSDHSQVTDNEDGYHNVRLSDQVEKCVDARFPDLKEVRNPYNRTVPQEFMSIYHDFWHSQIKPINYSIDEQVREQWKKVWRAERVDFRALPPAPPRSYLPTNPLNPQRFTKKDNEYQFGQITVLIEGEKKYRSIVFCANEIRLWAKNAHDINIKECLVLALPIAQRLDRVCDWSEVRTLPAPALNALRLRFELIKSYYTREYDREKQRLVPGWEYRSRLREFAMYGNEEALQAILQAEKDRHAPRHE